MTFKKSPSVACIWFEKSSPTGKLAELFLRWSPQISLRKDRAIFVEIGKCRQLYSEASFLARAQLLLRRCGHHARVCLGHEVTEALALAKFKKKSMDELPLEALFDFADPFDKDEALKKSVQVMIESFRDLGIEDLGHFKKIPIQDLIARFGLAGRHCHHRVHFKDSISWPLWKPVEVIFEKKEFPYFEFYGELDPILFELKVQFDHLFARLFSRKRKVTQLQIQITCEKVSTHPEFVRTLKFHFFTPQGSAKGMLRIAKERLHKEFEKRPLLSPIEAIETKVLASAPFEYGQKNIFHNDEDKSEELLSFHHQLVEVLGRENIFQAELLEDRRPEKSWKKNFDGLHESRPEFLNFSDLLPERATYLCRYPVRIEVTAGYVHIQKRRYRILHWNNQMEKISGGWFESPKANIENKFDRNYYQVELEDHKRITVFEIPERQFFLHGYYG